MPKKQLLCLLLLLECFAYSLYSQINHRDSILIAKDTLRQIDVSNLGSVESTTHRIDSIQTSKIDKKKDSMLVNKESIKKTAVSNDSIKKIEIEFKPNPKKAVLYSAIFPGLGQFYNRKYWKLPIVYGGVVGISYAITWNSNMYKDYMQAYKDLATGSGESYLDFGISKNEIMSQKTTYIDKFRRKKNFFKRNRDLAIICALGVYGLCMLDAYVDAQLYDFDISPDLSMKVVPIILEPTNYSERSVGVQLTFNF